MHPHRCTLGRAEQLTRYPVRTVTSLAADQEMFFHADFYSMLDEYIDTAPEGSNEVSNYLLPHAPPLRSLPPSVENGRWY